MLLRKQNWITLASPPPGAQPAPKQGSVEDDGSGASVSHLLEGLTAAIRATPDNALPLMRFGASHDITVEVFGVPGGYLAMTNISPFTGDETPTTASGKGFDAVRAVLACLGEAAEVFGWACRRQDVEEAMRDAPAGAVVDAVEVLGFSADQIGSRARLNRAWHGWDAVPPADRLADPGHWVRVQSFDGDSTASCPAFLCFGHFGDVAHGDASMNVDSNGCAAGPTLAEARKRALLELVERDAAGIWWHGGTVRTRLDPAQLPGLQAHIRQHRHDTLRRLWLLDISSFRSARTVAAVSCEDSGESLALGFGAGFSLEDAARSAFLEVVQSETAMLAHDFRVEDSGLAAASDGDCRMARWKRFADVRNFRFAIGTPADGPQGEGEGSVDALLAEIRDVCGQEVWFADLTRSAIGIPVAKAICGGLSHFRPRWGCRRNIEPSVWAVTTRRPGGLSQARKLLI
jgi:thiazole/oxazole-forming peptide maturase SagD family component